MQNLIKDVQYLISIEYQRASTKFGPLNHSEHESSAIISEEVEELRDEFISLSEHGMKFWEFVKSNASDEDKTKALNSLHHDALLAACEAIQVAAMAYKAEQTIKSRGEHK